MKISSRDTVGVVSFLPVNAADPARLRVAQAAAREVLCLPFHGGVSLEQASEICELIRWRADGGRHD